MLLCNFKWNQTIFWIQCRQHLSSWDEAAKGRNYTTLIEYTKGFHLSSIFSTDSAVHQKASWCYSHSPIHTQFTSSYSFTSLNVGTCFMCIWHLNKISQVGNCTLSIKKFLCHNFLPKYCAKITLKGKKKQFKVKLYSILEKLLAVMWNIYNLQEELCSLVTTILKRK